MNKLSQLGIVLALILGYLRSIQIDESLTFKSTSQEVNEQGQVLENGKLVKSGWARRDIRKFDSSQISFINKLFRFKQWDYFHLTTEEFYLAVAFVDLGYVQSVQFTYYSLRENKFIHKDKVIYPFQTKQFHLTDECTLQGNLTRIFKSDEINIEYKGWLNEQIEMRMIQIQFDQFFAQFIMESHQNDDLFSLKPFNDEKDEFFYSRKAYGWHSYGQITSGQEVYQFTQANGGMDYGRGIFKYATFWVWLSGMGFSDDHRICFNFGAGNDGGNKGSSDEGIFIDQQLYKLNGLDYKFDLENLNSQIFILGEDLEIEFTPKSTNLFVQDMFIIDVKFRQLIGTFKGHFKQYKFDGIVGIVELNRAKW